MTIDSSLAAVQAALLRRDVAAHNLANLRTEGYRAYRARQVEAAPGAGPAVEIERTARPPEMVEEMVAEMIARYDARANLVALRAQHQMLGTVIDLLA